MTFGFYMKFFPNSLFEREIGSADFLSVPTRTQTALYAHICTHMCIYVISYLCHKCISYLCCMCICSHMHVSKLPYTMYKFQELQSDDLRMWHGHTDSLYVNACMCTCILSILTCIMSCMYLLGGVTHSL